ncbi:MAG: hypothetical protein ACI97N_001825, partial [Cognaticolwellia sp.]
KKNYLQGFNLTVPLELGMVLSLWYFSFTVE